MNIRSSGLLRSTLFGAFTMLVSVAHAAQAIEVFRSDSCGCCLAWGAHMEESGFSVAMKDMPVADLMATKTKAGLKPGQTSCHTAFIDGYVVEGHVPAREVKRLLEERPDAIGLTVPDMPYGSPGMGEAGPDADPYDVLLVRRDGTTEVYASYR